MGRRGEAGTYGAVSRRHIYPHVHVSGPPSYLDPEDGTEPVAVMALEPLTPPPRSHVLLTTGQHSHITPGQDNQMPGSFAPTREVYDQAKSRVSAEQHGGFLSPYLFILAANRPPCTIILLFVFSFPTISSYLLF